MVSHYLLNGYSEKNYSVFCEGSIWKPLITLGGDTVNIVGEVKDVISLTCRHLH